MTDTNLPVARSPVEAVLAKYEAQLQGALNQAVAYPAFVSAVMQDCVRQPKLMEAVRSDPNSFGTALLHAAQLQLIPGSGHGRYYLIPRKMGGRMTVTSIVGYKGLCDIAQRHERVHSVEAFPVYRGEEFSWEPASASVVHRWGMEVDRSDENIVGGYAIARITEAHTHNVCDKPIIWAMTRAEIEKSMRRSESWKWAEKDGKRNSPWHTDYAMMARKTLLRSLLNHGSVPQKMELAATFDHEDQQDIGFLRDAEVEEARDDGPSRGDEIMEKLQ